MRKVWAKRAMPGQLLLSSCLSTKSPNLKGLVLLGISSFLSITMHCINLEKLVVNYCNTEKKKKIWVSLNFRLFYMWLNLNSHNPNARHNTSKRSDESEHQPKTGPFVIVFLFHRICIIFATFHTENPLVKVIPLDCAVWDGIDPWIISITKS